jgi:hypothetical protein
MGKSARARRAEIKKKPLTPGSIEFSRKDICLLAVGALVALFIWLEPDRTPSVVVIGLAFMAICLVIPVFQIPWVRYKGFVGVCRKVIALVLILFFTFAYGKHIWPSGTLGKLSEKEVENFSKTLKQQTNPAWIHIMCPPNDEIDCALASQFVGAFGTAGWSLRHPYVDRVPAPMPRTGIYLVLHSTADIDFSNPSRSPGSGVWIEQPNGLQLVTKAFKDLGADLANPTVGTAVPENTIGVYFGQGSARR